MEHSNRNRSVIEAIGNTTLVKLQHMVPDSSADIYLKLEAENPTGSIKDRMALAMITAAERDGRLSPGGDVVEYTAGSTGVALAFVCKVKGYQLHVVSSDAFSIEKRNHMQALGAKLSIVPSNNGAMDEALTRNMIERAREITNETGGFWTDQLNNSDQLEAYHRLGEELLDQMQGDIDAFVHSTGTAATVRGVSETLHAHNSKTLCVAVEPAESAVLSGHSPGAHGIEGVGAGFVVPLWEKSAVDRIATVSTDEAMNMARRLAREEGVFAGTSTGANLVCALDIANELGPGGSVVTIMGDSGMKYMSTALYGTA